MPIYEYYCAENHTVYQFYAKTLKQGQTIPRCPDNPAYRLQKMVSGFAVTSGGKSDAPPPEANQAGDTNDDNARFEAAARAMEPEFAHVDENDPKAMARMMRRMAELSGEKIGDEAEEVVRKLEEGADPEALEEQLGGEAACPMPDPYDDGMGIGGGAEKKPEPKESKHRFKARRPLRRDPKLYDYE